MLYKEQIKDFILFSVIYKQEYKIEIKNCTLIDKPRRNNKNSNANHTNCQ